ncbi:MULTISPECIES: methylenetetrahydrofolate reductase [unclassified Nocardioides]|uniref:methylenetetrahydrofolate reductase n=1 Tax=unclassified Nocardioides TaxID=2615069 RepID=UPI0009F106B4|nr:MULTISPECIES: methylenetetrahydrofolate reductase [unclassified Nocardioides]GAW47707.1 Methylenetetrahydrofolate reductase [Nocardioides sp. PD653-B2]GAW56863.1 Methylenetetrahydrofolate reductase [Nocardioides sp. PD653]
MSITPRGGASSAVGLLHDFSLEITGKDAGALRSAGAAIPAGTRVHVTYLAQEDLSLRLAAARTVREVGLVAVPHVSARRLRSRAEVDEFVGALRADGNAEHLFLVAGDPRTPEGPYADTLAVIESGVLEDNDVRQVGVTGYPEGHPYIPDDVLWRSLEQKMSALAERAIGASVTTQFGFDADQVLSWVEKVRQRGVTVPVGVGVPGPAGARRLLAYAARCGVGTSASIAKKYGLSLSNLMGSAGPDRFLDALAARYDERRHGDLRLHFYTFGGVDATAAWTRRFANSAP